MVEDEKGRAIEGARVWVLGYDEPVTTGSTGNFSYPPRRRRPPSAF